MIALYNKDFTTKYGTINTTIEAFVEEERNGLFELSFIMLNTDSLFSYIKEDNIVVANANDTLLNQKFRIYMTRKLMNNRIEVFARHISFDLMYDYIDNISFENQSCEYALNQLFRNSNFSSHYKGYSDIINAQNYSMSMANILEAIGGKEGSLLDAFGNGAELLRDNENIHVLNKRGYDNSVIIEYKKNLTGFELEEDNTDLVTRILPYAKYRPKDSDEDEVTIKASYIDSPLLANYSHPFIKAIDYTDRFEEGEEVTVDKLISLAQREYNINKADIPKQNFKIEFIPLSKCVGYEGLEDSVSLCDTVTIKDTRYNINTKAKIIKVVFNVLKNRYESIEIGEPRTTLGDVINNTTSDITTEDVKDIVNNTPSINFPNTLPKTSVLSGKSVGLASIELEWTFENKAYYSYELYGSKEKDFTPNSSNLIQKGQISSFLYQAKPNETWHFKVCAINSRGNRNNFSNQVTVSTAKVNAEEWIEEATIGNALIGNLSADKINTGTLRGNYIDARQLSVTDGNGKRTLDIDSFGNVSLDVSDLKIKNEAVSTSSQLQQLEDKFIYTFNKSGNGNMICNSKWLNSINAWEKYQFAGTSNISYALGKGYVNFQVYGNDNTEGGYRTDFIKVISGNDYNISFDYAFYRSSISFVEIQYFANNQSEIPFYKWKTDLVINREHSLELPFTADDRCNYIKIFFSGKNDKSSTDYPYADCAIFNLIMVEGKQKVPWTPHNNEIYTNDTIIDGEGISVVHKDGSKTQITSKDMGVYSSNGNKKTGFYKGSMMNYNWNENQFLSTFGATKLDELDRYGVGLFGTDYCKFVNFGVDMLVNNDAQDFNRTLSMLRINFHQLGEGLRDAQGVHIQYRPLFIYDRIDMKGRFISNVNNIWFNHGYTNMSVLEDGKLGIACEYGVSIGTVAGEYKINPVIRIEDGSTVSTWADWYFNNGAIFDANIITTLSSSNRQTIEEDITLINPKSTEDIIQHFGEGTIVNGECIINIPIAIAENISSYKIFLTPCDNGRIWCKKSNRDRYYFVVEGDNIEFEYMLIGNKISTFKSEKARVNPSPTTNLRKSMDIEPVYEAFNI